MDKTDTTKTQPEVLAKFGEAARDGDGKPDKPGLRATGETAPVPMDPRQEQDAATKVLREGVFKRDEGAEEAIDKLPDRILKK